MKIEHVKTLCELSKTGEYSKELALVEIDGNVSYMLGMFSEKNVCIKGMSFTRSEMVFLFKWISEHEIEKILTEEEKFLRDYIQQAHNGKVEEIEKELKQW